MNTLQKICNTTEKEYQGLGRPLCFSLICYHARRPLLLVADTGSGKSQVLKLLMEKVTDFLQVDSVTRSALVNIEKEISDTSRLIITKDLGALSDTRQINENLSTGITLTTEGEFYKATFKDIVDIQNFTGSYITTIQPRLMRSLLEFPNFDNFLREKSTRYYHMLRSINEHNVARNLMMIREQYMQYGDITLQNKQLVDNLVAYFRVQTSVKRSQQYAEDVLNSYKLLIKKKKLNLDDIVFLEYLCRPLNVEQYCLSRFSLNTELEFNIDVFGILTEFATWEQPKTAEIARDYGLSRRYIIAVLKSVEAFWIKENHNQDFLQKTQLTKELLFGAGYEH